MLYFNFYNFIKEKKSNTSLFKYAAVLRRDFFVLYIVISVWMPWSDNNATSCVTKKKHRNWNKYKNVYPLLLSIINQKWLVSTSNDKSKFLFHNILKQTFFKKMPIIVFPYHNQTEHYIQIKIEYFTYQQWLFSLFFSGVYIFVLQKISY